MESARIQNIMENKGFVGVSVLCMVYNHEEFLRNCLDGFVCQETNFPFEIIIHDDKSTDHSADIIREYAEQYPNLFRPIFQKENQYSQGISIFTKYMMPLVRGRYIAFCEGDDYWCDPHKLQRQFDYMENHPECTLCTHNSRFHYLNSEYPDFLFNDWEDVHILTDEEVFQSGTVHTSSYFYRPNQVVYPEYTKNRSYWFKDYITLVISYQFGTVVCLPGVMSVYNAENPHSLTGSIKNKGYSSRIHAMSAILDFLSRFDQETEKKYHEAVTKRAAAVNADIEFYTLMLRMKELSASGAAKEEMVSCADQLAKNDVMIRLDHMQTGIHRLTFRFRMKGYRYCYPLWKKLLEIHVLSKISE